jgi:hypothetical protein
MLRAANARHQGMRDAWWRDADGRGSGGTTNRPQKNHKLTARRVVGCIEPSVACFRGSRGSAGYAKCGLTAWMLSRATAPPALTATSAASVEPPVAISRSATAVVAGAVTIRAITVPLAALGAGEHLAFKYPSKPLESLETRESLVLELSEPPRESLALVRSEPLVHTSKPRELFLESLALVP